tara:strand:+ start:1983 stop:3137 length:1155 start_codon:yes stop_codon:yes gene_type:complete
MADTLYFSRDTRVFINKGTQVWELPVLDGFSFSQSTNSSEITLSEMSDASGNSRRGRQMFNDSFAPAEWSFSTYARPFASAGGTLGTAAAGVYPASATANDQHAVEEVLWAQLVGAGTWSAGDFVNCTSDATDLDISFAGSNKTTLGEVDIYFVMGGAGSGAKTTYQITGCVVNEAALDFDIDGITTIAWSGTGKKLTDITGTAVSAAGLATTGVITPTINEGIESTSNFIRNRITNLGVATAMGSPHPSSYNLVLTGGSINISNNMTYLTPETLGVINQPLGAVTGTRTVGGSFTCYLNAEDDSSAELFDNISSDTTTITNVFDLTFNVGGSTAPFVQLSMENCHLELPSHAIDDVISVEVTFHALPSNIETADEISIIYKGA